MVPLQKISLTIEHGAFRSNTVGYGRVAVSLDTLNLLNIF